MNVIISSFYVATVQFVRYFQNATVCVLFYEQCHCCCANGTTVYLPEIAGTGIVPLPFPIRNVQKWLKIVSFEGFLRRIPSQNSFAEIRKEHIFFCAEILRRLLKILILIVYLRRYSSLDTINSNQRIISSQKTSFLCRISAQDFFAETIQTARHSLEQSSLQNQTLRQ